MTSPTPASPPAQDVRALFDRIAPAYDQLNDWLSLGLHRVWKQMTVKWSEAKPGDTVLDVCCGSGDLARILARQVGKTGKVYGVDFACAQLDVARQKTIPSSQTAPIDWQEGDALDLPFEAAQFDAATMGYGLRNVTDVSKSLSELHRVLKPGAKAAILDFHRASDPLMRSFQQWYLNQLVVPAAARFGLRDEYAYINPSLDRFPIGPEQIAIARSVGFSHAVHYPIANGMMGVLVATR